VHADLRKDWSSLPVALIPKLILGLTRQDLQVEQITPPASIAKRLDLHPRTGTCGHVRYIDGKASHPHAKPAKNWVVAVEHCD